MNLTEMSRRFFVKSSLLFLTPVILGMGFKVSRKRRYLVLGFQKNSKGYIGRYDFSSGEFKELCVDPAKKIHEIFQVGSDSSIFIGTDKRGQYLVKFDVEKMKLLDFFKLKQDFFYGHGVYDSKRQNLWLTAYTPSYQGRLKCFDPLRFKEVKSIKTNGVYPHQIQTIKSDHVIVGQLKTSAENASLFSVINLKSQKVVKQKVAAKSSIGIVDHFCVSPDGTVVAPLVRPENDSSGKKIFKDSPVYTWNMKTSAENFSELPNSQYSQNLTDTVIIYQNQWALISNSLRYEVLLFDFSRGQVVDRFILDSAPLGISLLENKILVNTKSWELITLQVKKNKLSLLEKNRIRQVSKKDSFGFEAHSYIVDLF